MDSKKPSSSTSAAGLFGQPLGGDLSFDNLSGPKLFTPVPLLQPAQQQQTSSVQQQVQSSFLNVASTSKPQLSLYTPADISNSTNINSLNAMHISSQIPDSTVPTNFSPGGSPLLQQHQKSSSIPNSRPTQVIPPQPKSLPNQVVYSQPNQSPLIPNVSHGQMDPPPVQIPTIHSSHANATQTFPNPPLASSQNMPTEANLPKPTVPASDFQQSPINNPIPTSTQQQNYTTQAQTNTVVPHWFYYKNSWVPFSFYDSVNIEEAYIYNHGSVVVTDGGRFDVDMQMMVRKPVFWNEAMCYIQRCTWFYKGEDGLFVPYDLKIADALEVEYMKMLQTGICNVRIDISPSEFVILHNSNVMVHYVSKNNAEWSGEDAKARPRVVQRGLGELGNTVEYGEGREVDHLVFVVHGIGPVADLQMRSIVECVDDFRRISLNLTQTHGFVNKQGNQASRVEFLPIQWYSCLHNQIDGVDRQLKNLTLPSIGKLRNFTNDTLTDILFYTSPAYCQIICDTIVKEMNRMYSLFCLRHPTFNGKVSTIGHSLGSCILFDILANQKVSNTISKVATKKEVSLEEENEDFGEDFETCTKQIKTIAPLTVKTNQPCQPLPPVAEILAQINLTKLQNLFEEEQVDTDTLLMCSESDLKDLGVPFGPRKKLVAYLKEHTTTNNKSESTTKPSESSIELISRGTQLTHKQTEPESRQTGPDSQQTVAGQPLVNYAKISFSVDTLFALGSPLGLFLTTRGVSSIGSKFQLNECPHFYNIFHPYDPVVYRLEPLVNELIDLPPVLIPHHKGRKRFHLEIKENLSRVGANLKSGLMDAVSRTWSSINDFARAHTKQQLQQEQEQQQLQQQQQQQHQIQEDSDDSQENAKLKAKEAMLDFGLLNSGKRLDYVLQERPYEIFNEYLFALGSHTCYWTSEDTALLILKSLYEN